MRFFDYETGQEVTREFASAVDAPSCYAIDETGFRYRVQTQAQAKRRRILEHAMRQSTIPHRT